MQKLRSEGGGTADNKDLFAAETKNGISFLIGADHLWKLVSGEVIGSMEGPGLVTIDTAFGWALQGQTAQKILRVINTNLIVSVLRVEKTQSPDLEISSTLLATCDEERMGRCQAFLSQVLPAAQAN
ncbi:hypothetical protein HPB50_001184 [Hyalomma asiaticum]|uniref:Uncharacterized protein n=1 Tax=Hyalomma asiaticum TaxID=266040 RepID=A0ACB7SAT6_HYAAI|nr:hypothetical protein HPB50_001184 [Hyalomma asiaticum]